MTWKEELIELSKNMSAQEMNEAKKDVNTLISKYPELKESENVKMMLYIRLKFGLDSLLDVKKRVYDGEVDDDANDSLLSGLFESNIESSPQDNLMFFKSSLTSIIQNEERLKIHYVLSQDNPRMVNTQSGQLSVKSIHFWVEKELRDVTLWGDAVEKYEFQTNKAYKMVTTPAREGGYFIDTTIQPVLTDAQPPDLQKLVDYVIKSVPEAQPPFKMLSNLKTYHLVGQLLDVGGQFTIMNKYTKNMDGMLILFNSQRLILKSGMKFVAVGKFGKKRDSNDMYFYPEVLIDSRGIVESSTVSKPISNATPQSNDEKNDYGEEI